ncbi:hypothetical protein [uncultured Methanobrevibacter sp.]|uniref:hypothetical protein n=1 Tax=uncultured Methanobrevibacter sp. TaxID=253161 RepID=UPI0025E30764|nr:hypothetical protein [uncultured Methanobrevibacter sp.]
MDEELDLEKIKEILENAYKYGTGLFITDQKIKDINTLQILPEELETIGGEFDYVVINLNKSLIENDTNKLVKILLEIFEKVKTGGIISIPNTTYQLFNGGRKSMEALLKALNYKIELPPYGTKNNIIASKR